MSIGWFQLQIVPAYHSDLLYIYLECFFFSLSFRVIFQYDQHTIVPGTQGTSYDDFKRQCTSKVSGFLWLYVLCVIYIDMWDT